ncbi:MAG: tRNA adenosine(34) deaminase TadA [candidate division Zixibacteria bacterium]|nr:tRNA adenosine(34) deaminase TadA [candidate division Zixibacteria bacterium]
MFDGAADTGYWMRVALTEAEKAYRIGEVPVGAVIVRDGQILGRGYNQTEKLKDPTAHAEILAITSACQAADDWRLDGAVLYCTLEPCSMCAGAAVLARIQKIVFGAADPKFGACGSIFTIPVEPRLNHRVELEGGVMADEVADLMRAFFREVRQSRGGSHDVESR